MGINWDREMQEETPNRRPWEELEAQYGHDRATAIRLLENASWQLNAYVKSARGSKVKIPVEQLQGAVESMKRAQRQIESE